ncbi:MAG: sigma-70 family RNA polymerase sigma factor [Sedimentisphaerales bacterium]|nr:sigma-70 family RNA polymerase sigma factor [Sedimentisphaerales bacterium]
MRKSAPIKHGRLLSEKIEDLQVSSQEKRILHEILPEPIAYVPDPQFRRPSVMNAIMDRSVFVPTGKTLKHEQETLLFTQMNYARFRLCQLRRKLLRQTEWQVEDVRELLANYHKQLDLRSQIVAANMGLVLAMAKRTSYEGVEFTDLISEGSMALLRATEKYDCQRGLKFSTYACQAIFKGFSRAAMDSYRHRNLFPAQLDLALEKDDSLDQLREQNHEEMIEEVRAIFHENLADLNETEYNVLDLRFRLNDADKPTLTLKEVGARLGLTKERIRQIQNKALAKLRQVTEERMVTV